MLRHARKDMVLCRKRQGPAVGYVCAQHEGHCVLCDIVFDTVLPTMRPVRLCGDCAVDCAQRCVACGASPVADVAYYCHYCCALGKDADGCPRALHMMTQKRLAGLRAAVQAQASNDASASYA